MSIDITFIPGNGGGSLTTPNVLVRPPRFLPEDVVVSDWGENVELKIGNSALTFHYADALKISQMLRVHAKRSKIRAGDTGRHWSVVGTLEDDKR